MIWTGAAFLGAEAEVRLGVHESRGRERPERRWGDGVRRWQHPCMSVLVSLSLIQTQSCPFVTKLLPPVGPRLPPGQTTREPGIAFLHRLTGRFPGGRRAPAAVLWVPSRPHSPFLQLRRGSFSTGRQR